VTTGLPYESGIHTEILDLTDPDFKCTGLPDYPLQIKDGGGALIKDDMLLVCGGYDATSNGIDECYSLSTDATWSKMDQGLEEARFHAGYGSIVVNESLWNSGGELTKTSELVNGLSSVKTSDLPEIMFAHCAIQINDSVILVTGGKRNVSSANTYFHDFETGQWSDGPTMTYPRYLHGCKSFMLNGDQILIVAGGDGPNGKLKEVEFLNMNNLEQGWIQGRTASLPEALAEFPMVTSINGENVFIIGGDNGGKSGEILKLECSGKDLDTCGWRTSKSQLTHKREDHVAVLIPDTLVKELCNN